MLSLQVAERVRYQSQPHGGVVILDTTAGLWLALNPTAGQLWRSWDSGAGFDASVAEVAARHPEVPPDTIRADAEQLVQDLLGRGLIDVIPPQAGEATGAAAMAVPADDRQGPRPGWFQLSAALMSLLVATALVRCSFRASFVLVRASRRSWCRRPSTTAQAAVAVAAVSRAARRYPGRAACLEQSLAAVLLCAAQRRRLDWCLGSVPDPYRFHAWVELSGQPVPAADNFLSQVDHFRVVTV